MHKEANARGSESELITRDPRRSSRTVHFQVQHVDPYDLKYTKHIRYVAIIKCNINIVVYSSISVRLNAISARACQRLSECSCSDLRQDSYPPNLHTSLPFDLSVSASLHPRLLRPHNLLSHQLAALRSREPQTSVEPHYPVGITTRRLEMAVV